ncbi:MAG TPA: UDP-N-acetylmuramoyl-L-alanine--D-glutamate ligase [Myxococcota bacterium]
MLDLAGKRVLVLGLGISGLSAARFCAQRGASVLAADERPATAIGGLEQLPSQVERQLGAPFPDPGAFDLVVPSPGVPRERYAPRARRAWGDLELAYRALEVPIVAITGTNGKSTTTLLVEALLRAAGLRARAAGNLGAPALGLVGEPLDFAVLEVSSFQLEAVEDFRPRVAVVLNATPDHLDRHGSFEAYLAAKARLLAQQGPEDTAVLNFDDPAVRGLAEHTRARVVPFRTQGKLEHGAWYEAGCVVLADPGGARERHSLSALRLPGVHNRENAVAALAAVVAAGASARRAVAAFATFEGLPHRMQTVACTGGVEWVNDSKATNPGAALRSLRSYETPLVWIAGGRDKGLDFRELAGAAQGRVRAAVLIGEAAGKLEAALAGRVPVHDAGTLERAVGLAAQLAKPGDVVLLAPACASFDQFRGFEDRGDRFRAAVAALGGEAR